MATVAVPLDVLSGRPDPANPPEYVYITGTNFPSDGYAFPNPNTKVLFLKIGAELYGTGNWTMELHWYSRAGSTSGNVTWSVQMAAITPGDAQSVETKAFATAQTVNTTVNATARGDTLSTLTISNLDSVAVGDDVWLRITRTDTSMVGDAILMRASLSYSDGSAGYVAACRTTSDQTSFTAATMTDVTGLAFSLPAAGTYSFQIGIVSSSSSAATITVACTCSTATSFAIAGNLPTATNSFITVYANAINTASNGAARTATGADFYTAFTGSVTVSAAGTLQFRMATTVTTLTVRANSSGICVQA